MVTNTVNACWMCWVPTVCQGRVKHFTCISSDLTVIPWVGCHYPKFVDEQLGTHQESHGRSGWVIMSCFYQILWFSSEISWSCMLFLFLQKGPSKTPVAAICLTSLVTMAFVLVGQVNVLAPIITINFMLTYIAVDYYYFSLFMGACSLPQVPESVPGSSPLLWAPAPGEGSQLWLWGRCLEPLWGHSARIHQGHGPTPPANQEACE